MLGVDTILIRVRHSFRCRATVPRYCAPHAARHPLRVPSARTCSCCASRLGRFVLSAGLPPLLCRRSRLSWEEARTLCLSTVAPSALLEVARSIQLCLCEVLDTHRYIEEYHQRVEEYRQKKAAFEAELDMPLYMP
jgi:hypothetical protein